MQEKHLFEYAVIRLVPRVEREEFLNVGVILYCARPLFLQAMHRLDPARIQSFCPESDLDMLAENLLSFDRICAGSREGGLIASLDPASRFRWLTAKRSTVLQPSPVHPGFCADPQATLRRLFEELVLLP